MIPNEAPVLADSLWTATAAPTPAFPPLQGEVETEVAVVGGGVTGLSAALHLAERGIATVVLEAQAPGWGASGRNGGQLNPGLKHDPEAVVARFGPEMGERMLAVSGNAPSFAMNLVRRHAIACAAIQPGWIQPAHDAAALRVLETRAAQWARRGVAMRILDRAETAAHIGTDVYLGALLDPRGASVQPLDFTLGLARAAQVAGVVVHGGSPVKSLETRGETHILRVPQGVVRARRVLLCTNGYSDALVPPLARTLVPVRSVQVATEPLPERLRSRILPGGQTASDSRRVMVYYRLDPAGRLVMGGRGDYSDRITARLMENLRRVSREMFPFLATTPFRHAWGGFVAMTADHYPHLSELAPGVLSATGFNGRGLALATALGPVLADWAEGRPAAELAFAVTPARPIPFHALRKPAVRATVQLFRLRDALGI